MIMTNLPSSIDIHKNVIWFENIAYHYATEKDAYLVYFSMLQENLMQPTDWLNALECPRGRFDAWVSRDLEIDDEKYLEALETAYEDKYKVKLEKPKRWSL